MRLPIKLRLLNKMIDELSNLSSLAGQPYLLALYKAIFVSAYYGLLRVSEITGSAHSIKSRDVHLVHDKAKVQFRIWTAKNKKRGSWPDDIKLEGLRDCKKCYPNFKQTIRNSRCKDTAKYCPIHILLDYHRMRPVTRGVTQFFCYKDESIISQLSVRNMIKRVIRSLGLGDTYNGQSFHSGRACDLRKLNYSIRDIKSFGHWHGNSVLKYFK